MHDVRRYAQCQDFSPGSRPECLPPPPHQQAQRPVTRTGQHWGQSGCGSSCAHNKRGENRHIDNRTTRQPSRPIITMFTTTSHANKLLLRRNLLSPVISHHFQLESPPGSTQTLSSTIDALTCIAAGHRPSRCHQGLQTALLSQMAGRPLLSQALCAH